MNLGLVVLILTCLVNLTLGLLVLLRNPKIIANRYFAILTAMAVVWLAANFLTEALRQPVLNTFFNRVGYLMGFACVVMVNRFCYAFPTPAKESKVAQTILRVSVMIIGVLSLGTWVDGTVVRTATGVAYTLGPLVWIYESALVLLLIHGALRLLRLQKRTARRARNQVQLVLAGFITSVTLGIIFNLVIPSLVPDFATARFGPLVTLPYVIATTYAIIKYGLFDVKLIVARSAAYVLVIATSALTYTALVFTITHALFTDQTAITLRQQQIINIGVALFLAFSFSPAKKFFDKVSNRLFYRDAYAPQVFLDQLNQILVSALKLEALIEQTNQVIMHNLKAQFAFTLIRETSYFDQRLIGRINHKLTPETLDQIRAEARHIPHKVIIADYLENDSELQKLLQKHDIAVIIRLVPTLEYDVEGIGYIFLGSKKSGNSYNYQDVRILEIIANEMVIAIQNALRFEEIENFNITLQKKVDDATSELRDSNEKLKALDETKDEFISMASHQLRTPLTSVKGYLSMTIDEDAGKLNETQHKLLYQAFVSSQRMVYLIADLLNVSRLRTGKFVIEAVPTNLAEVIEGEVHQLQETAASRRLSLAYEKPADFPTLLLDETKIRQVIMNFLDNAIYYTPAGGHIRVELEDTGRTVSCRVVDDGLGVPKAEQHHLFTKFYRAGNAKKARPDGTGLGLFMAKKVIVAQGGSLLFESAEGKGSTFGFSFAKAKVAPPEITAASPAEATPTA